MSSSPSVLYRERHDLDGSVVTLLDDHNGAVTVRDKGHNKDKDKDTSNKSSGVSVSTFLRQVFLPEGYPQSVSEDYLSYQVWDTVQAFASSISGSLATKVRSDQIRSKSILVVDLHSIACLNVVSGCVEGCGRGRRERHPAGRHHHLAAQTRRRHGRTDRIHVDTSEKRF